MSELIQRQTSKAAALWEGLNPTKSENSILVEIIDHQSRPGMALNGTTAFFRNGLDTERYIEIARNIRKQATREKVEITVLGGSVGAQAYSLAYHIHHMGLGDWLRVNTLDLSQRFTAIARHGIYPEVMGEPDRKFGLQMFDNYGHGYLRIKDHFRKVVNVLPAQCINKMKQGTGGDIIVLSNVLGYLSHAHQAQALKTVADRARHTVALMGGQFCEMPYYLKDANLHPATGPCFSADSLWDDYSQGRSTLAFKPGCQFII